MEGLLRHLRVSAELVQNLSKLQSGCAARIRVTQPENGAPFLDWHTSSPPSPHPLPHPARNHPPPSALAPLLGGALVLSPPTPLLLQVQKIKGKPKI